jgi:hypothetical protein
VLVAVVVPDRAYTEAPAARGVWLMQVPVTAVALDKLKDQAVVLAGMQA